MNGMLLNRTWGRESVLFVSTLPGQFATGGISRFLWHPYASTGRTGDLRNVH